MDVCVCVCIFACWYVYVCVCVCAVPLLYLRVSSSLSPHPLPLSPARGPKPFPFYILYPVLSIVDPPLYSLHLIPSPHRSKIPFLWKFLSSLLVSDLGERERGKRKGEREIENVIVRINLFSNSKILTRAASCKPTVLL